MLPEKRFSPRGKILCLKWIGTTSAHLSVFLILHFAHFCFSLLWLCMCCKSCAVCYFAVTVYNVNAPPSGPHMLFAFSWNTFTFYHSDADLVCSVWSCRMTKNGVSQRSTSQKNPVTFRIWNSAPFCSIQNKSIQTWCSLVTHRGIWARIKIKSTSWRWKWSSKQLEYNWSTCIEQSWAQTWLKLGCMIFNHAMLWRLSHKKNPMWDFSLRSWVCAAHFQSKHPMCVISAALPHPHC